MGPSTDYSANSARLVKNEKFLVGKDDLPLPSFFPRQNPRRKVNASLLVCRRKLLDPFEPVGLPSEIFSKNGPDGLERQVEVAHSLPYASLVVFLEVVGDLLDGFRRTHPWHWLFG